jgi:hypothetical protein
VGFTPLDTGILTSTLLKEGPDVVACWALLLSSADKVGESSMSSSTAASLLRISDERAEAAFDVLASPDPKSRNKEHDGRRILPLDGGKWFIVSHAKYQWLASRAAATERQRKYEARQRELGKKTPRESKPKNSCAVEGCFGTKSRYGSYCADHERDSI